MIDIDRLNKVSEVYYHGKCSDGLAAAMIIASAYGRRLDINPPKFIPLIYNSKEHNELVPKHGQLFVDITPPITPRWKEWEEFSPIILDHHETAESVTKSLGGVYETNDRHSGAVIAYEQVFKPLCGENEEWEKFATLIMIRDTWKDDHLNWYQANALSSMMFKMDDANILYRVTNFNDWITSDEYKKILSDGFEAYDELLDRSRKASKSALIVEFKDMKLAFLNLEGKTISDTSDILKREYGCSGVFGYFFIFDGQAQKCIVSVRSNGKFAANKLAQIFGGGGHQKAAGFTISDGALDLSINKLIDKVTSNIDTLI